jgi:hypothetical protein
MRRPGFFAGCAIKPAICATILDFVKGTVKILKKVQTRALNQNAQASGRR